MYADFVRDPASVAPEWASFFQTWKNGDGNEAPLLQPRFKPPGLFNPSPLGSAVADGDVEAAHLQSRVNQLVRNYRVRGHNIAAIDPLGLPRPVPQELELAFYGFTEADLARPVLSETLQAEGLRTVGEILQRLRDTYCRSIGVQYMHIDNFVVRRWLQKRMEGTGNRLALTREEQIRIYTRLTDAVSFEEFIRKKFVGAKSFSLEGCESLIPLLDLAIEKAAEQGTKEIVFGMAHRGRLNVLANIIGKSPRQIFREFTDDPRLFSGRGDVKYHLGYSSDWETVAGNKVHLSLCFNPSHLEFVNPVVLGRTRAKQDRSGDTDGTQCMALLIHGDAAFIGQGVTQETLNMSLLPGYTVHGTVHVIVNNQIGFTTSPSEGRSCGYSSDVARMLQIPIFHVNGEDPEAVAQVVRMALDFRQTFKRDVVIDMYGYRRLGHNEGDEPSFTQPVLYRAIEQRKTVREGYLEHLLALNDLTREEADAITTRRREVLDQELSEAQSETYKPPVEKLRGVWSRGSYVGGPEENAENPAAQIPVEKLSELLRKQTELPENFNAHPKIQPFLESRRQMASGQEKLNWSAAEALAFAVISTNGLRVRLSGQDCGRGTFSQRHAILYDYVDGHPYVPLQNLEPKQGPVTILNSPLSETGVLGFDYGYSLDCPDGLICWEAQFGDFINSAQVIVDQFIASAEDKWNRLSGLVLLLPHGFEGQGPEHSSARLERFLALAAQDNIQVIYPTTPAQYFHCLREQVMRRWRKPLIVMTPKSLLRHPRAVSAIQECATGEFQRIIPDASPKPENVRRIILCTGKIFYDLQKQREDLKREDVAIIRMEQLYPRTDDLLREILTQYPNGTPVFWTQEEPENMGAWRFLRAHFGKELFGKFPFYGIYRLASASPATGSISVHKREQQRLVTQAFAEL